MEPLVDTSCSASDMSTASTEMGDGGGGDSRQTGQGTGRASGKSRRKGSGRKRRAKTSNNAEVVAHAPVRLAPVRPRGLVVRCSHCAFSHTVPPLGYNHNGGGPSCTRLCPSCQAVGPSRGSEAAPPPPAPPSPPPPAAPPPPAPAPPPAPIPPPRPPPEAIHPATVATGAAHEPGGHIDVAFLGEQRVVERLASAEKRVVELAREVRLLKAQLAFVGLQVR